MRTLPGLEALAERIEKAEALDGISNRLAGLIRTAIRPGPVEDVLSGTPIGHPLHPVLIAVPLGAWTSATMFDLLGDDDDAARRLIALGCLAAVPTAASGASDWLTTAGAERRVGLVHALTNYAAITLYGLSWQARRRGDRSRGVVFSSVGLALVSVSGWLGGHLSFAQGVGVDTTAFQKLPAEWTDAGAEADVPESGAATQFDAGGIPVLVSRHGGRLVAMADRCTHRGAPLHEGDIADGCIHCPWHDSVFSLDDGSVTSGPATRPQPTFEVRVDGGRVLVRRQEPRTLRANPVGR